MEPKAFRTVREPSYIEFEEKKSIFIGRAYPVKSEEEALAHLKEVRREHRDATHNVYAFLLGDGTLARYSDDGEPQGTAGMPVLDAIRKSGLCDVCVIVTRYFGGTLLGAGGLVRAYSHTAVLALEAAGSVTYEPYEIYSLRCGYADYQKYSNLLNAAGAVTDSVDFGADVALVFAVKRTGCNALLRRITEAGYGKHTPERIGERFDCQ